MESARWIIVWIVAIPAGLFAAANLWIGCRNLVYFTSRSPSPIPVVGFVLTFAAIAIVPKTGSAVSKLLLLVFFLFLVGEFMPTLAEVVNKFRALVTKRPPS